MQTNKIIVGFNTFFSSEQENSPHLQSAVVLWMNRTEPIQRGSLWALSNLKLICVRESLNYSVIEHVYIFF